MGLLSFLFFAGPEPTEPAPQMPLRRMCHWSDLPPESDYTVIDIETSGLDARTCEVLEIGAIRYRNNTEEARFRTYVCPEGKISKAASEVNHLTWRKLWDAPSFEDAFASFISFIADDVLIGYNIDFDIKFLQTRSGQIINNPGYDVLQLARATVELDRYRLDDLRRHFYLYDISHTAIGDCLATAYVFQKCRDSYEGQRLIQKQIAFLEEQQRIEEERQRKAEAERARIDAARVEKIRQKALLPPTKELYKISAQMTGTADEYIEKVKCILTRAGYSLTSVQGFMELRRGVALLCIKVPWMPFFGVKTTGRLKYIILDLPPEEIRCNFVCGPTTMEEGERRCRIFVPSPEALDSIADYIIASFAHAKDTADQSGSDGQKKYFNWRDYSAT